MSNEVKNVFSKNEKLQQSVLRNFFTEQGSLINIPARLKKRLIVLEYLANQLDAKKLYSEKELNEFIRKFNDDFALIRRELYIHKFVNRINEIYEVNNREDWQDWKTLK